MELPFTTQKMKYLIRDMTASTPPCHKDPVSLLALQNFFYSPCHNTGAAPLFPQAVFTSNMVGTCASCLKGKNHRFFGF